MATFLERAANSVNHMFPLLCIFVVSVVSHLGFEDGTFVLITPVPGHCFPFTFVNKAKFKDKSNLSDQVTRVSPGRDI